LNIEGFDMRTLADSAPTAQTKLVTAVTDPSIRVVHGDYDPVSQTFYCQHHDNFQRIGHFGGGGAGDWAHTPTRHIELYLGALARPSAKPRKLNPSHNIFAQLVFQGREPSRDIVRVLLPLLWGELPIDVRKLTAGAEQIAAYQVDQFRRALGDV
jgi:hypothetical protein